MLDRDRARELAKTALAASPADETEVVVDLCEEELNRFTADHPVQNLVRRLARISVRVRVDGREGKASTGTPTPVAVRRTVDRAIASARHLPPPPGELLPLPEPRDRDAYGLRDRDPLRPDPRATARSVAAMTGRCRDAGCAAAGIHTSKTSLRVVMNSNDLAVDDLDTVAQVSVSAFKDDGAGWAAGTAAAHEGVDDEAVARGAVEKAVRSREPVVVDPGHYTVILEPDAASALLLFASYKAFGAQQVDEGTSFLADHLGERLVGENVSIADDVHHPLALGYVFDGEGLPRQTVPLIDHGIAKNVVHDRRTAQKWGCRSTGHALPQPNQQGPIAANLVLAAGDAPDLLAGVDRGILVTQFHYTNMVEPTRLTLTGMTRNGTFLVENGEVTRPVQNLRFTQSLVEALNRVSGIGSTQKLGSALFGGYTVVPALRIDGFRFSSRTEF
jgi:predicted Zn-dependent protease